MSQPEMEVDSNGEKHWYLNGKLHRVGGPAIEWSGGGKCWYLNGKLHREGGPAIELPDGTKYWYLDEKQYSFEDYILELERLGLHKSAVDCLFEL